jgi:hypothetical protein
MPRNNCNQQVRHNSTAHAQSKTNASLIGRKAAGTRFGTLLNWRAASKGAENTSPRHGQAIRDGRQ